jgi:hypothetical protein
MKGVKPICAFVTHFVTSFTAEHLRGNFSKDLDPLIEHL